MRPEPVETGSKKSFALTSAKPLWSLTIVQCFSVIFEGKVRNAFWSSVSKVSLMVNGSQPNG